MRVTDDLTPLMDLDSYALTQGVATRTVRRWLDRGEVPGAQKVKGKWAIPADATRQPSTSDVVATTPEPEPMPTMDAVLSTQTAFLDLDTASRLLGVSVRVMKAHRDDFGLVRYGVNGAYVMPQAIIRKALG